MAAADVTQLHDVEASDSASADVAHGGGSPAGTSTQLADASRQAAPTQVAPAPPGGDGGGTASAVCERSDTSLAQVPGPPLEAGPLLPQCGRTGLAGADVAELSGLLAATHQRLTRLLELAEGAGGDVGGTDGGRQSAADPRGAT